MGVNGAGKTVTFKMLTRDATITSGDAWVQGFSIKTDKSGNYANVGYCPQQDALFEDFTGRENLTIICLLRGIPSSMITETIQEWALELSFDKYLDKKVQTYSDGTKRKLSTALALIGNPSVVYLDEPTTGLDPRAKKQLWGVLIQYRNSGKSIVLTSHSMEECEALCSKLAIMIKGEFKCLGSTHHLKKKFSKGTLLIIHLNKNNSNYETQLSLVKEFVQTALVGAELKLV